MASAPAAKGCGSGISLPINRARTAVWFQVPGSEQDPLKCVILAVSTGLQIGKAAGGGKKQSDKEKAVSCFSCHCLGPTCLADSV